MFQALPVDRACPLLGQLEHMACAPEHNVGNCVQIMQVPAFKSMRCPMNVQKGSLFLGSAMAVVVAVDTIR